jgi:quinoprotein glucose dehydrogenase
MLARLDPAEATRLLEAVLDGNSITDRQEALRVCGSMSDARAEALLRRWLERLVAGDVEPALQLDLLEAASERTNPDLRALVARFESSRRADDPLALYRESLAGGDRRRGRQIFLEKDEVSCQRCHKIRGQGGEVGPDLTGIGKRQSREYILEAIVAPNRQIAQGFATAVIAKTDGQIVAGIVKADDGRTLQLITPEGNAISVTKSEIDEQKTGASAMPEDLIKSLSKSELRDLVEYLSSLR